MSKRITCCQCGTTFTFSDGEQRFYDEMQFVEPKRCPACRKFHFNPYEMMNMSVPAKRRHTRVGYAPYLVGGFRG